MIYVEAETCFIYICCRGFARSKKMIFVTQRDLSKHIQSTQEDRILILKFSAYACIHI